MTKKEAIAAAQAVSEATHTVMVIGRNGGRRPTWKGGGEIWTGTEREAHVFAAKLCQLKADEPGTFYQVVELHEKSAKGKRR